MEKIHLVVLLIFTITLLMLVLGDKYASTSGKLLGVAGAAMVMVGYDSFIGNMAALGYTRVFGEETRYTFFIFSGGMTFFFLCAGGGALYMAVGSWVFTSEDKYAIREADEKEKDDAENARVAFHPQGSVLNVRNHVAMGSRGYETERFTEIETTTAVLVVYGEVGSVAKGLTVYTNSIDQLRIGDLKGGRTFTLRGSSLPIAAV